MWPGAPASETSRCYCQSLCELSAQSGEGAEQQGQLVTFDHSPCPGATETRREEGPLENFDPACKVTAALTPPCWTPVYGRQRHFQRNVISNQWPPRGHVSISDSMGRPSFTKKG